MISVLNCKFMKIIEYKNKSTNRNFYLIYVLNETDKNVQCLPFFISNQDALNLKDTKPLTPLKISFDLYFTKENTIRYTINKIVLD